MKWLQDFITEAAKDRLIKSSELFEIFFSYGKDKFYQKKKELTKLPEVKSLVDLLHFDGKAEINVTAGKVSFAKSFGNYLSQGATIFAKLQTTDQEIAKHLDSLSVLVKREADLFKELALACAQLEVYYFLTRSVLS